MESFKKEGVVTYFIILSELPQSGYAASWPRLEPGTSQMWSTVSVPEPPHPVAQPSNRKINIFKLLVHFEENVGNKTL
jgi:hypothetical protein